MTDSTPKSFGFVQDEGHERGGDGIEDDRVDEEDVEEAREAEFTVGDVERVGAVLGVPSDKGVEEIGVQELGVDPKGSHVDGAGNKACEESGTDCLGQAKREQVGRLQSFTPEKSPDEWGANEQERSVAWFDPLEVGGAEPEEVFHGHPHGAEQAKQKSGAKSQAEGHRYRSLSPLPSRTMGKILAIRDCWVASRLAEAMCSLYSRCRPEVRASMASLNAGSASKASCKVGHHDGAPWGLGRRATRLPSWACCMASARYARMSSSGREASGSVNFQWRMACVLPSCAFSRMPRGSDSSAPSKNQRPQWCLNPAAMAMLRPACT